MSLQVGEMPDSNPGLQVSQSGALPLSHHIPSKEEIVFCCGVLTGLETEENWMKTNILHEYLISENSLPDVMKAPAYVDSLCQI